MSIALDRLRIYLSWLLAIAIGWGVSSLFRVPHFPGFSASLMQQPSPFVAFLAAAAAMVLAYIVAWVLAGRINVDLPLASSALSLLSIRFAGGSMYHTLEASGGDKSVYLSLAIETVVLFVLLAAVWFITRPLQRLGAAPVIPENVDADKLIDPQDDPTKDEPLDQKLIAILTGSIMTAFCLLFLARSDAPRQGMFAILVASSVSAWIAHRFIPARGAIWFWLAPLPVALIGYLTGYFAGDPGLTIGESQHYFAALTRLVPLDYASLGVAGAIWGYTMRRDAQLLAAQEAAITASPTSEAAPAAS
jgi:hypothetical protein